MKLLLLILILPFFLCCTINNKEKVHAIVSPDQLNKLERLLLLFPHSIMDAYDLSNDSITNFPDLSAFTIKSLNLSSNLLDTIIPHFLPKGLEKLNLSHNHYCGYVVIRKNTMPALKELDMSYNLLNRISIGEPFYRILLSHNDLSSVCLNHENIRYLVISYNSNMAERVCFNPDRIDTIVREGVANGKRLITPNAPPRPHLTFLAD